MFEEETFYIKKITPNYTTVPALKEIVFKPQKYDSMKFRFLL